MARSTTKLTTTLYSVIICDSTYINAAENCLGSVMLENLNIEEVNELIKMTGKQSDVCDIIIRKQNDRDKNIGDINNDNV